MTINFKAFGPSFLEFFFIDLEKKKKKRFTKEDKFLLGLIDNFSTPQELAQLFLSLNVPR